MRPAAGGLGANFFLPLSNMKKSGLEKGVVYLYNGTGGADGANILFTVMEDNSFNYHADGCIVLHWSGNRYSSYDEPGEYGVSKHHLPYITEASRRAVKYYNKCVEAGKEVGGYSWHDSNEDKRR